MIKFLLLTILNLIAEDRLTQTINLYQGVIQKELIPKSYNFLGWVVIQALKIKKYFKQTFT